MVPLILMLAAFCLQSSQGAGYKKAYSYLQNGADWQLDKESDCWKSNQSPIDLRTDIHSEPFEKQEDEMKGTYSNLTKATVVNKGLTIQVDIPQENKADNFFESKYSQE